MKKVNTVEVKGKIYTEADIRTLILTNDQAVKNALVRIYDYQTLQEKLADDTIENNGVGFSGADGRIMSDFAKFYKQNKYLSPKQIGFARKRLVKYSGQILRIMAKAQ